MSTWTGTNAGDPDSITDHVCYWKHCYAFTPKRFHDAGLNLCRDHALLAWSVVNSQLGDGMSVERTPRIAAVTTLTENEKRYGVRPLGYDGLFNMFAAEGLDDPGVVYYIRTGGRIKIGHSINLERRLAQYPPDVEVLYVQSGGKDLERHEHAKFRIYLADGREWFQDRSEVVDLIAAMASANHGWERHLPDEEWWRRRRRVDPEVVTRRIS
ncbi:G-I-Y Y-I-G endonuclease [Gordonia phage Malisha]|nr:G-I-Y Y-I-G endonuclease [Gordonia phage Malisha]